MTLNCEGHIDLEIGSKLIEIEYIGQWSPDEGWADVALNVPVFTPKGIEQVDLSHVMDRGVVDGLIKRILEASYAKFAQIGAAS